MHPYLQVIYVCSYLLFPYRSISCIDCFIACSVFNMSQGFGDISCTLPKNGRHFKNHLKKNWGWRVCSWVPGWGHSAAGPLLTAVGFVRRWRIDANGDDRNVVGSTTGISSCIMANRQRCRMSILRRAMYLPSNFLALTYVFTKFWVFATEHTGIPQIC